MGQQSSRKSSSGGGGVGCGCGCGWERRPHTSHVHRYVAALTDRWGSNECSCRRRRACVCTAYRDLSDRHDDRLAAVLTLGSGDLRRELDAIVTLNAESDSNRESRESVPELFVLSVAPRSLDSEGSQHSLRSELQQATDASLRLHPHLVMCGSGELKAVFVRAQNNALPAKVHTQVDYIHRLVEDLQEITACSFYWGKMDRYEAERLLDGKPEGTFLLRDSAQEEHLFSVSFRKYGRSLHARIEHNESRFSFDSHDPAVYSARTVTHLLEHYKQPIGFLTTSAGAPVGITDVNTLDSDIFTTELFLDDQKAEFNARIPERTVHGKGTGAFGYFEVLNDVSKYTKIDAFNGVGKITPTHVRFSAALQERGGSDLDRDNRGLAVKFYTEEGNLDLICLHVPVFSFRDPIDFYGLNKAFRKNPKTGLIDFNARYDFVVSKPIVVHSLLWLLSDFGIPRGYRKMDAFTQHAYQLYNERGDIYYARFNFRSEQGLENFTSAEAAEIKSQDLDYFNRDLYNAIENGEYPEWYLEMDVLSEDDIKTVDFNPFDLTSLWPKDAYKTVKIGRLVLNRNVDNQFEQVELSVYSPSHLVPGTIGAPDSIFTFRKNVYLNSIRNRIGPNHEYTNVNLAFNVKTYNRDGLPPIRDNMKDLPNYFPNSFNGPQPTVDPVRPKKLVVSTSNAVDLKSSANFYNNVLKSENERQRLCYNIGESLVSVYPPIQKKALKLFKRIDKDLGARVKVALAIAEQQARRQATLV